MSCTGTDSPCVVAGDSFSYDSTFKQNDEIEAVNLTGATATMDLRDAVTDAAIVISMSGGIIDAEQGEMQFTLTKTQTAALLVRTLESRSLVFSIRIEYQDLTVETILTGTMTIHQVATAA
jgi:hypothetical protein